MTKLARVNLVVTLALLLAVLTLVVGCAVDPSTGEKIQTLRQDLAAEMALLPEGDPLRKEYEEHASKLDAALRAWETGNLHDPGLRDVAEKVPYGGLVLSILGVGYGVWKRRQAAQIVTSVEQAYPHKTEDEKAKLRAGQSPGTRKFVDKVKAKLPPRPVKSGA